MATDKRIGSKIPKWANPETAPGVRLDRGTYIGIVKGNLDPTRSGRLQIWIPDLGGDPDNVQNWRIVNYASPFYGSTYLPDDAKSTENSYGKVANTYGMWAIPPDIGNQVLCTFVAGDPMRGYWFACVNPSLSHAMIPAVGQATTGTMDKEKVQDPAVKLALQSKPDCIFPVVEFNENDEGKYNDTFLQAAKPIHEFQANILIQQGLHADSVRGAVFSSSQRETPSTVFGISTPGRPFGNDPADDPSYETKLANNTIDEAAYAVKTRKGGHTFIMDDGDPVGKNQMIRLRTAGGHQILMNDSDRMMYIANSDGSIWIELTGSGEISVYSGGSVNIRAQNDFNFTAGGNFNIDATGNFNVSAGGAFNVSSNAMTLKASGAATIYTNSKLGIGSGGQLAIDAGAGGSFKAGGNMSFSGSRIDLNNGDGATVADPGFLTKNSHSDTGWDPQKGLWINKSKALASIAAIAPAHEPWPRMRANGTTEFTNDPTPYQEVTLHACTPKYQVGGTAGAYPGGKGPDMPAGDWAQDTPFLDKTYAVAKKYNMQFEDLLACMYFESNMRADIVNSIGATGLIQFVKSTATGLGTSTDALSKMGRVEQMDWVDKFFGTGPIGRRKLAFVTLSDLYASINWPAAVGKPEDYVMYSDPSSAYTGNKGLDLDKDAKITKAEAASKPASKLPYIRQQLEKVGYIPGQTGGASVSNGSGNVVAGGSNVSGEDPGIAKALGLPVNEKAPVEYMKRQDAPNPNEKIDASGEIPGLTGKQVQALMVQLAFVMSNWDPTKIDSTNGNTIGRYQMSAEQLADLGYIKPDAVEQYRETAITKPASWTGKDGIKSAEDFVAAVGIQDSAMMQMFKQNYTRLVQNGGLKAKDDICTVGGMLAVAHQFRRLAWPVGPTNEAKKWRMNGTSIDNQGTPGETYYNYGRYAIDILSVGEPTAGSAKAAPSGSGLALNPQLGIVKASTGAKASAAADYVSKLQGFVDDLEATGYKITSMAGYADRDVRGIAGVKSAHAYGAAIDINPAANPLGTTLITDMNVQTVRSLASKWGLGWGGDWRTRKDAMHFSLMRREGGTLDIAVSASSTASEQPAVTTAGPGQVATPGKINPVPVANTNITVNQVPTSEILGSPDAAIEAEKQRKLDRNQQLREKATARYNAGKDQA